MNKAKKFLLTAFALFAVTAGALGFVSCGDSDNTKNSSSAYFSKGLLFKLNSDGASYSLVGVGTCEDTDIVIPATYEGLPVIHIAPFAFDGYESLTSVEIGDNVISIGSYFNCENLANITISEGNVNFSSIDGNLYSKDGKTLIQYAIGKTATSFTVPDGVTSIDIYAFAFCDGLTSVEIGDDVTSIGWNAFDYCTKLTSVYYKGTAGEWNEISIGNYNSKLTNATRYYYSEEAPTTSGNYWHYNEDGEVVVW